MASIETAAKVMVSQVGRLALRRALRFEAGRPRRRGRGRDRRQLVLDFVYPGDWRARTVAECLGPWVGEAS